MTATATTCAICNEPVDGIPYGPREAECCADCWFDAGSYRMVRIRALGPEPGEYLAFVSIFVREGPDFCPRFASAGEVVENDPHRKASRLMTDHGVRVWVPWKDLLP